MDAVSEAEKSVKTQIGKAVQAAKVVIIVIVLLTLFFVFTV